jgi:alkanesulfonate monooxygenase SsuD/methylene tetrahydromethanopterin reductase-like flavin-dependent oxidoreductase (luciferase family)
MQVGIHIASFTWPGAPQSIGLMLAEIARKAEDCGIRSISVMDHFFQMGGAFEEPMLEGYTTLGSSQALPARCNSICWSRE